MWVAKNFMRSNSCVGDVNKQRSEVKWISRSRPLAGYVKLNMDGASVGNSRLASTGGLLGGEDGQWIFGFAQNIGIAMVVMVEL